VEPAATFGREVQSLPHAAQLWTSCGEAQVPGAPQVSRPLGHAHEPHWQSEEHVCEPPPLPQARIEPGPQFPWAVQAIHVDHVPLLQVRVCVPQ
jgi:hypothetical protein